MRIALINEGTYPYGSGALGTWCEQLVRGLDEHAFWLVNLVEGRPAVASALPPNVARLTTIARAGRSVFPDGGPVSREAAIRQHRRLATHAAVLLCRGMVDDGAPSAAMFRTGLRRLTGLAADGTHPLVGVPLGPVLLDAWRAGAGSGLPRPTIADAENAAMLLERAVRPLAARLPDLDLCHVVHSGGSVLVALAHRWRNGVPYVLTEHDGYGTDPLLAAATGYPEVQAVLHRFLRALTRLGNAEASAVTPPDERMRQWALRHDADPAVIRVVPPGLDPYDHPPLREEPTEPVLAWLGEPAELPVALAAFDQVRRAVPDARLIVIGAAPDGGPRPVGVNFSGPVTGYRALFGKAGVVAMSGGLARMPYPLLEAMFCGRATVCTDLGGLDAMVGAGARTVPPGDPAALAAACVPLLTDVPQRRALGAAARELARTRFRLDTMLDSYREVYPQATASAPAERLAGLR